MLDSKISRRDSLFLIGSGAALTASGLSTSCAKAPAPAEKPGAAEVESPAVVEDRV